MISAFSSSMCNIGNQYYSTILEYNFSILSCCDKIIELCVPQAIFLHLLPTFGLIAECRDPTHLMRTIMVEKWSTAAILTSFQWRYFLFGFLASIK